MRKATFQVFFRKFSVESKNVGVVFDKQTGIASVFLQRPPVNSMNLELLTELSAALTDLESNDCKGIILRSVSKVFVLNGIQIYYL